MMNVLISGLFSLLVLAPNSYAKKPDLVAKVKGCNQEELKLITEAVLYGQQELNKALTDTGATDKQKKRYKKRFNNLRFSCVDNDHCWQTGGDDGAAGYVDRLRDFRDFFSKRDETIRMCRDSLAESAQLASNSSLSVRAKGIAKVAEVVFHELGHTAEWPINKKHNDPLSVISSWSERGNVDKPYRMGAKMYDRVLNRVKTSPESINGKCLRFKYSATKRQDFCYH